MPVHARHGHPGSGSGQPLDRSHNTANSARLTSPVDRVDRLGPVIAMPSQRARTAPNLHHQLMPGSHRFHGHRHRLGARLHQGARGFDRSEPFLDPDRHALTFQRSHHRIRTVLQQLLAPVKPVVKILQQRVEKRLQQCIGVGIPTRVHRISQTASP